MKEVLNNQFFKKKNFKMEKFTIFKSLSEELNANGHYDSGKSDTETLFNFIMFMD